MTNAPTTQRPDFYLDCIGDTLSQITRAEEEHAATVRRAHDVGGLSWAQIAEVLGVSRQAAYQRFGRSTPELEEELPTGPLTVGLVACGKGKVDHAAPAGELYTGDLFRKAYAHALATCDRVFILSARHNLVHPLEELEPYERTLRDLDTAQRKAWGAVTEGQLRWALRDELVDPERDVTVMVLAGNDYTEPLLAAGLESWPTEVVRPLKGLGIGQQLSYLKGAEAQRLEALEG